MRDYFLAFKNAYHLPETEWAPQLWKETATCLEESFAILTSSLADASKFGDNGLYLRIAENCVGRLYENSSSMIACLACGTTSGVEALARVVIEGAWTTRYILEGDYKKRMFSYIFQYLREHPRKLSEWKALVEKRRPDDELTLQAVSGRKDFIDKMYSFFNQLRHSVNLPEVELLMTHWSGSLFKRCEAIGETEKYYTHYHRLSADSHQNAEQTMLYLFGYFMQIETGESVLDKIGLETIYYSSMMAALAVDEAIVAAALACDTLSTKYSKTQIIGVRKRLRQTAELLGSQAGAPIGPNEQWGSAS